jgi:hypothetical protein
MLRSISASVWRERLSSTTRQPPAPQVWLRQMAAFLLRPPSRAVKKQMLPRPGSLTHRPRHRQAPQAAC